MEISIKVNEVKNMDNIKGFATVVFGESFKITNIAILENNAAQSSKWTHFLNIILRKDRIMPAFPYRMPLFHLECNLQVMSEGVQCCNGLYIRSKINEDPPDFEKIFC